MRCSTTSSNTSNIIQWHSASNSQDATSSNDIQQQPKTSSDTQQATMSNIHWHLTNIQHPTASNSIQHTTTSSIQQHPAHPPIQHTNDWCCPPLHNPGQNVLNLSGHTQDVFALALLSDGNLASCGSDGVRIWNIATGLPHTGCFCIMEHCNESSVPYACYKYYACHTYITPVI